MSVRPRSSLFALVALVALTGPLSGQPSGVRSSSVPPGASPRPIPAYAVAPDTRSPLPSLGNYSTFNNSGTENTTVTGATLTRADAFYNAGYTGVRAFVANVEGGLPWLGHETMNWADPANLFSGSGALSGSGATAAHATAVSHALVGHGPTDRQRGIAYGVPASNFFAGNVATQFLGGTSFDTTYASEWNAYSQAMIGGVGGDPNKRADVVNSSWGSTGWFDPSGSNGLFHRYVDGLLVAANDSAVGNRGVTVVFSAGNAGSAADSVFPRIGASYNAISVAALGERVQLTPNGVPLYHDVADFSSRSPTRTYIPTGPTSYDGTPLFDSRVRVDIAAPGSQVYLADGTTTSNAYARTQGTSFAAPTVSGGVALLADYDRDRFSPAHGFNAADLRNALDARVIKAVLLNGSDKPAAWSNGQSLTTGAGNYPTGAWVTTQALDFNTGAGSLNLGQVYRNLAHDSPAAPSQVLNAAATNTGLSATGWAYGVLNRPDAAAPANNDFAISSALGKFSQVDVTLSWFVDRSFNTSTGASGEVAFHNLNLEVWRTDAGGTPIDLVAASRSVYTNTEHLSFLVPEDGRYMVRVTRPAGAAGTNWDFGTSTADPYGLAWMTRPAAVYTGNAGNAITTSTTETNILVAPEGGQTATLTLNNGSTTGVLNRVYVGGSDRSAGGTGALHIEGAATLNFSNQLRVYAGGTVNVGAGNNSPGALLGGLLTVDAGGTVNLSNHPSNVVALDRVDLAGTFNAAAAFSHRLDVYAMNISGGQFNVTSGTANYILQRLTMTGGSINMPSQSGTTILSFWNFDPSVTINPSAGGSVWSSGTTAAGGNRIHNDGVTVVNGNVVGAALPITVADGPAAVDLNAGILLSNGGWGDARATYRFLGQGTTLLTNPGNSGNFLVEGGRLRVDDNVLAPLGTGTLALNGGALAYGNAVTNGSMGKAIAVGPNGGTLEVMNPNRALALNAAVSYGGATLTKTGPGTLVLNVANTGNGSSVTSVNAGTLQLGAPNVIPDGGTFRLNGGTFSSGAGAGNTDVVGSLQLSADSTLVLGTGHHTITFSGLVGTPTGVLTVTGWSGLPNVLGTAGEIEFTNIGVNPNVDHLDFLRDVQFVGFDLGGATFLLVSGGTYELVPVPEPGLILGIAFGVLALGGHLRRLAHLARITAS
jgi:autotransporter-associated beta strand protein